MLIAGERHARIIMTRYIKHCGLVNEYQPAA